jgi:hypothetical protein
MNILLKNTLEVGTLLDDKWVILEFIDRGGMGEVYRAHQVNLKRDVAIKIISREWLASCKDKEHAFPSPISRQPWEAFEGVGFRGVLSATSLEK